MLRARACARRLRAEAQPRRHPAVALGEASEQPPGAAGDHRLHQQRAGSRRQRHRHRVLIQARVAHDVALEHRPSVDPDLHRPGAAQPQHQAPGAVAAHMSDGVGGGVAVRAQQRVQRQRPHAGDRRRLGRHDTSRSLPGNVRAGPPGPPPACSGGSATASAPRPWASNGPITWKASASIRPSARYRRSAAAASPPPGIGQRQLVLDLSGHQGVGAVVARQPPQHRHPDGRAASSPPAPPGPPAAATASGRPRRLPSSASAAAACRSNAPGPSAAAGESRRTDGEERGQGGNPHPQQYTGRRRRSPDCCASGRFNPSRSSGRSPPAAPGAPGAAGSSPSGW